MNNEENYKAAREWYKIAKEQNNQLAIEILENHFPEFAEIEDAWVSKEIIAYLKRNDDYRSCWIAWLEKQGKQESFDKCKGCNNVKGCVTCVNGDQWAHISEPAEWSEEDVNQIAEIKKQFEQKPIKEVNGEDYGIDGLWTALDILKKTLGTVDGYETDDGVLEHEAAITAVKKLYEQKPTEWSEKDETGWTNTMIMIKECAANHYTKGAIKLVIDWLESLKDRVLPHPKQEWGDHDMCMLENILGDEYCPLSSEQIAWLKSLPPQQRCNQEKIAQIKTQIALCNGFNRENRDKIFTLLDSLYS